MLLFPAEPYAGKVPDAVYADEMETARSLGLPAALLDFEALLEGDVRRALRWVGVGEGRLAVFRGWMMRPEVYARLHEGLRERGWTPIHSPEQYRLLHHLPESFHHIAHVSPRAVWLPAGTPAELDRGEVRAVLASFGEGAVVVKDYVKSRKHEWAEACFIPDASDTGRAVEVVETFLARQGGEFQGGLVLRAFEPFVPLAQHSKSGMPLTREYRLFFLDGRPISVTPYWEEGDDSGEAPPLERFVDVAASIPARFFTLDVAQRVGGEWRAVELGDGQVAGLPERLDREAFYRALAPLFA